MPFLLSSTFSAANTDGVPADLELATWADPLGQGYGDLGPVLNGGTRAARWYFGVTRGETTPRLVIVDSESNQVIGDTRAPSDYTLNDTWFGLLRGPEGRLYPFLAPGGRYLDKPHWSQLCLFAPNQRSPGGGACGRGFRSVDLKFQLDGQDYTTLASYRHNGGWLYDANHDGYDDIHLPYLRGIIQTISGRDGRLLNLSRYDAAQTPDGHELKWYHSGRNYGSFTPFRDQQGREKVLVMSANAVGTFQDFFCNVSRFTTVLTLDPKTAHYELSWSRFVSFVKHIFRTPLKDPRNISRYADGINLCMHRTGSNIYNVGAKQIALYSQFAAVDGDQDCTIEQYTEARHNFDPIYTKRWDACAKAKFLAVRGNWSVIAVDLADGKVVKRWPNTYLWAIEDAVSPRLLFEKLPPSLRFDRSGVAPGEYVIAKLEQDFALSETTTYDGPKPPPMVYDRTAAKRIGDTWGGVPRLVFPQ